MMMLCFGKSKKLTYHHRSSGLNSDLTIELISKINEGDMDGVNNLINSGADLNYWTVDQQPPLCEAVYRNQYDITKTLIRSGANVDIVWKPTKHKYASPLVLAVVNGYLDMLELLLTSGCDVEMTYSSKENILHIAVARQQVHAIRLMLKKSKRALILMTMEDRSYKTPWDIAVLNDLGEIIMLFMLHGYKKHKMDRQTILQTAVVKGMEDESTLNSFLKEMQMKPIFRDDQQRTLLHLAVLHNRVSLIPVLINNGVDIDACDKHGNTVLHIATRSDKHDAIIELMNFSAKPHTLNHAGLAPLHYAVSKGSDHLVRLLIITGNLWDVPNSDGLTAFQLACSLGHFNIMRSFLEEGADPSRPATNESNDTPHLLVLNSYGETEECLELLLEYGAKTDGKDSNGNSVLHAAVEGCCVAAVAKVLSRGVDVTATNQCQETALHTLVKHKEKHMAADRSSDERKWVAKQLILYDIKLLAKDKNGNTALYSALASNDADMVEVLLAYTNVTDELNTHGDTLVNVVLDNNHLYLIPSIIDQDKMPDINVTDSYGNSSLMLAAASSLNTKFELITLLLDKGANLQVTNNHRENVLHVLLKCSDETQTHILDTLQIVLSAPGVENIINGKTLFDYTTPLMCAIARQDSSILSCLLENGAKISLVNKTGSNVLHLLLQTTDIESQEMVQCCKVLTQSNEVLQNTRNNDGYSPLEYALKNSHPECLKLLCRTIKNAMLHDAVTNTLSTTLSNGDIRKARCLVMGQCLKFEEHILWFLTSFHKTNMRRTSVVVVDLYEVVKAQYNRDSKLFKLANKIMHLAYGLMLSGRPMLLKKFLQCGHGHGLIHTCIGSKLCYRLIPTSNPHVKLQKFLAAAEFNLSEIINAQNQEGETALWLTTSVVSSHHPRMIQASAMLLNAGADPNISSNAWSKHGAITPLEMALMNDNKTICGLLLIAGARPALIRTYVKGRSWLGSISINLETKGLLHAQNNVNFVTLANENRQLIDMTFSDLDFSLEAEL